MNVKYRLLKKLGCSPSGTIFEAVHPQNTDPGTPFLREYPDPTYRFSAQLPIELADDPQWFKEIKPWVPDDREEFFFIDHCIQAVGSNGMASLTQGVIDAGNYFRTGKDAAACAIELRKFMAVWKESHP